MFKLEKLEISGFKSFPDRTHMLFGEGITAIVGPNGCGKSNLSEAITWVLGEQSAKSLRGGKMEDVIFNGTRDRKPTGMAEVLLTLVAVADIAEHDADSEAQEEETRFDQAVETAARAAHTARALVEEMSAKEPSEDVLSDPITTPENNTAQLATETDQPSASITTISPPAALIIEGDPQPIQEALELSGAEAQTAPTAEEITNPDAPSKVKPAERQRTPRPRKRRKIVISAGERVIIGRRLYRTGDSEYLMNGRACLLRDIQDLFAGTGLGGAHYAIIEQGRIGQILSSKPLDRRALIEEAAGITKFKSRKRAAELRLESAKQNLTRLNDIISEVERQVNSLKRQAQKARRYRRLREEMRGLQKIVFTADYYRLNETAERLAREFDEAEINLRQLETLLGEHETEYKAATTASRSVEDDLTTLREQAASLDLEVDRARNRRAFDEQQSAELTTRIEELERDQQALEARLATLTEDSERREQDVQRLESELATEQEELHSREREYQTEVVHLREAESEIEQLRQRLLIEIGRLERARNLSANLEEALRKLDLRQASLQAERERAETRLAEENAEYERVCGEAEGNRARLAELMRSISERNTAIETLRNESLHLRSQLDLAHTERATAEHRLASLEDLDNHHAYYSDAVQFVLSPEHAEKINALGTLADFVEVEPQYERLVESLFGRELQCVLVPTIDDALAGVEALKTEQLGRGAFLVVGLHGAESDPVGKDESERMKDEFHPEGEPLINTFSRAGEGIREARHDESEPGTLWIERPSQEWEEEKERIPDASFLPHAPSFSEPLFQLDVLRAIDLLGLRTEMKSVVERAFPGRSAAAVVPDIEAALQLSIENPSRVYVTYEGEQVVNGRLIVTGAQAGQKGTSLLGLKREIKQLRVQTALLRDDEQQLSDAFTNAKTQLEEIEGETLVLDQELRQQEKSAAARDSQLEGLARDLERARQHVRVVESELQQAVEERSELDGRVIEVLRELTGAQASKQEVEQFLSAAQQQFNELRARAEAVAEQLSAVRASVAARAERLQAAKAELRRRETEIEELHSRINRNRVELYESHNRVEQLKASRAEGESNAARFETERAQLAEQIETFAQSLAEGRARMDELEATLSQVRQSATAAHDRRSQTEVERARLDSEAEHLTRTCFSELAMSLEDVVMSVELVRSVADQQATLETAPAMSESALSAASSLASDDDLPVIATTANEQPTTDAESARQRLDELRLKLDEMGGVNMMALEELEEAETRFTFLSEQRRDILDSIKLTEEALAEIKRRSRERFRHAFAHINENFQKMFVELFGGGRGEMILIDEDDVLESGIDIIAQPPGKRLQNVLLLSGGEKAMAAISLVLAIFQYRPSPFCILDEVDAPLDEINVGRFSNKVIEMSCETQFLVITHNKRTMESARALYGVTMEEPGISKLVSVKFE